MATTVQSFKVMAPFKDLVNILSKDSRFGGAYTKIFDEAKVAVLCGEEFFLRTSSWAGITIIVKELSSNLCAVDAIGFAGAQGLLKISWFSEESYIKKLITFLEQHYKVILS